VLLGLAAAVVGALEACEPALGELQLLGPAQLDQLEQVEQLGVGSIQDALALLLDLGHALEVEAVAQAGELDLNLG